MASNRFAPGAIVHIAMPQTIADGAQTQQLGELTFRSSGAMSHDVLTASDAELVEAMRFFAERMKMIVEPTGCLGFAAACHGGARTGRQAGGRDHQRRQRRPGPLCTIDARPGLSFIADMDLWAASRDDDTVDRLAHRTHVTFGIDDDNSEHTGILRTNRP